MRNFLRHLTDFRYLDDDPAMSAAFGDDIRRRVISYFRGRSPAVVATLSQLLTDEPPAPDADNRGQRRNEDRTIRGVIGRRLPAPAPNRIPDPPPRARSYLDARRLQ